MSTTKIFHLTIAFTTLLMTYRSDEAFGITSDTRFVLTELRQPSASLEDVILYDTKVLDNGSVLARETSQDILYHWIPSQPHSPTGTLHEIPWPVPGTFDNQGFLDITDSGRALVYMQEFGVGTQTFLWEPIGGPAGQFTPWESIGDLNELVPLALNESGQYSGYGPAPGRNGLHPKIGTRSTTGEWTYSSPENSPGEGSASQLNDQGVAIISIHDPRGVDNRSYRWAPSTGNAPEVFEQIQAPLNNVTVFAINDFGSIVGAGAGGLGSNADVDGYLWRPNSELGTLETPIPLFQFGNPAVKSSAHDVNDLEIVVGETILSAVVWSEATGDLNLNDLVIRNPDDERSIRFHEAISINNAGQILAQARVDIDPTNTTEFDSYLSTFLLTPIPEPSSALLASFFCLGFLMRRHRRIIRRS